MSKNETSAVGLFVLGLTVSCAGATLVMAALWATWGWPAAVGFVGLMLLVIGWAVMQGRG